MGAKQRAWFRWLDQARRDHVAESFMGVAEYAFRTGWRAAMKTKPPSNKRGEG